MWDLISNIFQKEFSNLHLPLADVFHHDKPLMVSVLLSHATHEHTAGCNTYVTGGEPNQPPTKNGFYR